MIVQDGSAAVKLLYRIQVQRSSSKEETYSLFEHANYVL